MTTGLQQHHQLAMAQGAVTIALVTVSDTRTPATDANYAYLQVAIPAAGHHLSAYQIIPDDIAQVQTTLAELASTEAQVILFNGGTGIAKRDTTFDALNQCLEKTLPGFGELFRMLSYAQIGAAAMLSRATAGVYRGKIVISVPGSPAAVYLAWEKLLAPEINHLVSELHR